MPTGIYKRPKIRKIRKDKGVGRGGYHKYTREHQVITRNPFMFTGAEMNNLNRNYRKLIDSLPKRKVTKRPPRRFDE